MDERRGIDDDSKLKINNADFIRYHIESYFVRTTTFKDLIFKLINRTYSFGIKEDSWLASVLVKKAKKSNPEILELFEGLNILMQQVTPIRNEIAHGGYYNDPHLILIESSYVIPKDSESKKNYSKTLEQLLVRNVIDMHTNEIMITTYVLMVFKKLLPVRRSLEKEKQHKKSDKKG